MSFTGWRFCVMAGFHGVSGLGYHLRPLMQDVSNGHDNAPGILSLAHGFGSVRRILQYYLELMGSVAPRFMAVTMHTVD